MAGQASDTAVRQRRSDGERTHDAILDAATRLASVEGIEGLTIGRLAEELGVSKSGVYAHFGSKEQLQLETIAAASAIFEREVIAPALEAPDGLPRLQALCDAHLSYLERMVFPGGCFFASLLAELDAQDGTLHEVTRTGVREWVEMVRSIAAEGQRRGEISADIDPAQLAFELDACLELANYHFVLLRDPEVLERARRAIAGILERARTGPAGG